METNFDEMGIYDLRNYARSLGINSPTTKTKDMLIKEINFVEENGVLQSKCFCKRGRPPKTLCVKFTQNVKFSLNNLFFKKKLNKILQNNYENIKNIKELFKFLNKK